MLAYAAIAERHRTAGEGLPADFDPRSAPGIERTFRFRDFREALTFVQKVGEVAETVSFGWGYATVSLRTRKIKGLHENDFLMATKIDLLALPPNG
jgi:pterin-4a-carbinolamine dehydratase